MKDIHVIRTGFLSVNTLIVKCGSRHCFVVDPAACKMSGDENKILDYLLEKKLECIGIVLTHSHFDHITGIYKIKKAFPKAKIAVHQKEFSEMQNLPGPMNISVLSNFGMGEVLDQLAIQPSAEIALGNGSNLSCLAKGTEESDLLKDLENWKVLSTPGHTPGSICLYNAQEKILISGDTLFDGGYGRTDMMGGSESDLIHSLSYLRETIPEGTKVYPGHDNFGFDI